MSKNERNALALLVGIGLLGHGARLLSGQYSAPPGQVSILASPDTAALARHAARSARLARPLSQGERIDVNRASAEDLARLPRVGPRLAKRIVADREDRGRFGSLAELGRVTGIGPAMLASIGPFVDLPAGQQPADTGRDKRSGRKRGVQRAPAGNEAAGGRAPTVYLRDLPRVEGRGQGGSKARGGPAPVNLNSAPEDVLITLPGIGRTRARAIVAYRESHGPFASVNELEKVPGLGPKLVRQLVPQVTVR
ncbi:MAG: helix-hairpin-helix domain-containing protein [Gemmatimonadales bacterium]